MAKVYDPILCMMVDKPDKAQDELKIVKEDGLWCVYKDGKQVGQSNSEAGAIRIYNRLESGKDSKARDVAPATQRYINTIRTESKSAAENFVRQAEQDDDVPENELKYVYKAYNDKFGYKFHDSASALDEAIKTADGATGDKLYADVKAIYNLFSNILLTYTNEQSVQKLANEGTKKCLELAAKVKGVRDEAINTCDASKADMDYWVERYEKGCKNLIDAIKQGRSPIKTVQKAKQIINQDYSSHWKYLKDAFASYVVSTAKEEAKGDLSGMIDNTSKVEKREWKEFADREKKLMKAKNDALKNVEQAFK